MLLFFVLLLSGCVSGVAAAAYQGEHELRVAQIDLDAGWLDRARWHLTKAAQYLLPDDQRLLLLEGYYHELSGHRSQAQQIYKKLLVQNPNQIAAMNNYAILLCREGKRAKALSLFRRACQARGDLHCLRIKANEALCRKKIPDDYRH